MHEVELAWELAELVHNHLTTIERNRVYMAIGAADTFKRHQGGDAGDRRRATCATRRPDHDDSWLA
jgi:hypothetical protein